MTSLSELIVPVELLCDACFRLRAEPLELIARSSGTVFGFGWLEPLDDSELDVSSVENVLDEYSDDCGEDFGIGWLEPLGDSDLDPASLGALSELLEESAFGKSPSP